MPAVARMNDINQCPIEPQGSGPTISTEVMVLINGRPVACMGDTISCAGPPATIISGVPTVQINGKPIATLGDISSNGGTIVSGCPTVIINS
ncbi:MAG: PAAR domain-containing protein [Pseudomonadota bacterium]